MCHTNQSCLPFALLCWCDRAHVEDNRLLKVTHDSSWYCRTPTPTQNNNPTTERKEKRKKKNKKPTNKHCKIYTYCLYHVKFSCHSQQLKHTHTHTQTRQSKWSRTLFKTKWTWTKSVNLGVGCVRAWQAAPFRLGLNACYWILCFQPFHPYPSQSPGHSAVAVIGS